MGRIIKQAPLAFGIAAACLAVAALVPLVALLAQLFAGDTITQLGSTLANVRVWQLLATSVGIALAVTIIALAIGVSMGVLLSRFQIPGRKIALLIHTFPVFLPPFLLAFGWFRIFARNAPLGSSYTSELLFGPLGVILVLAFAFAPIITIMTTLGLHGIDPSLEDSARMVSGPRRVLLRILLPLAWPSIALGALIVFALTISEVAVPMFLRVQTYPEVVFSRLGGIQYAPGEAIALLLPLLGIALLLITIDHRLLRRGSYAVLGLRSHHAKPSPTNAKSWLSILVWLACLLPLAPLVAHLLAAGTTGFSEAIDWIGPSMGTSIIISFAAATIVLGIGLVAGHALARGSRAASTMDSVAMFTFLVPSAVLGVGLVSAWNRPSTQIIYTTEAILVFGLVARYALLGIRTLAAVFHQSSSHYEQAAAIFGAGFFRRAWHILIPMHARGIAVAWLVTLVFCLRDFDTVISFYPPGLDPLPVRIFTLEANGPDAVIAALSMYHVLLTAFVVILGSILLSKSRKGT